MRCRTLAAVATLILTLLSLSLTARAAPSTAGPAPHAASSWPPDTQHYARAAIPADRGGGLSATAGAAGVFERDVVLSNTDPTLAGTRAADAQGTEPGIAINPSNRREIDISAFSNCICDAATSPLWHSTDGGALWSEDQAITAPPGLTDSKGICFPCDQTFEYSRFGPLAGSILAEGNSTLPGTVVTGTTTDPTTSSAWTWPMSGTSVRPDSASGTDADQPQIAIGPDPSTSSADDIYTAYDDFATNPVTMRVAASPGTAGSLVNNVTIDTSPGTSGTADCAQPNTSYDEVCINPGLRIATDPRNRTVYTLYQVGNGAGAGTSMNVSYVLNRSTDGGRTWGINGSSTGLTVATADSDQGTAINYYGLPYAPVKFGNVNALIGGIDHLAVDPTTGDVYVVYGARDSTTGNDRLVLARLVTNASGTMSVASTSFISGQIRAALPSIAITQDGVIGVLYDVFDGTSSGFPQFTANVAMSFDHGSTFSTIPLETFLSPATDNGNPRQRVLGDYQQLKAAGNSFYGVFTGNGVPLGRTVSTSDPIFFTVPALQIALAPGSDSGAQSTDNVTNVTTPTFTGYAPAGSTVQLLNGTSQLGTATTDTTGAWQLTAPSALADGWHNIHGTAVLGATTYTLHTLSMKIDTVQPVVNCGAPDGQWHGANVLIGCTASDSGSGLAQPDNASFSLTTNVAANAQTANASTGTRKVCDVAGNCLIAGPISGNMVDRHAPTITFSPTSGNATFLLNQGASIGFTCSDATSSSTGSGIASCTGPDSTSTTPQPLNTSAVGVSTFTANATDNVGNAASKQASYDVTYGILGLSNSSTPHTGPFTLAMELQDANKADKSESAIAVNAPSVLDSNGTVVATPNPSTFTFVSTSAGGKYTIVLDPSPSGMNLPAGTYRLVVSVAGDPKEHQLTFTVG